MTEISSFKGDYRFLSMSYPTPVQLDGVTYPTAEHAFQAAKSCDMAYRAVIRVQRRPSAARKLGRKVVELPPNLRDVAMLYFLRQKFAKNPLRHLLLETYDCSLVNAERPQLGVLLMQVRRELLEGVPR